MWKWPVLYLAPPPFSARAVYAITFSIKQLLFQRLFTALAVLRTCQSHLETEESLCPILLATQLQDSKLCLDGTFSSGSNCSNLLAIDTDNQKGAEEEHSKDFIPCWKDGKNIPPSKERHDNFQLQAIQCVIHTLAVYLQPKLKPEYLPPYSVAYFHGRRLVSWV